MKAAAPISTVIDVVQRDFMDLRDDLDEVAPPWSGGQVPLSMPASARAQRIWDVAGV